MTKLALLISKMEGFGVPGATPTVRHNPGDLRHGPHCEHPGGPAHANDVGTIDTNEHGWQDLERQLQIYASEGLNLRQMVHLYAPEADHNNTSAYLNYVLNGLQLGPEAKVSEAIKIPA